MPKNTLSWILLVVVVLVGCSVVYGAFKGPEVPASTVRSSAPPETFKHVPLKRGVAKKY